ncbi:hypothetical protein COEREDRAFT_82674, partial [Coemansia reversa NRRL 1564]
MLMLAGMWHLCKLLTNSGNVCSDVNTTRSIIDCASWMDRDAGVAFKKKNTAFLH